MITTEDQVFLAQQKGSEHFRVFKKIIQDAKTKMLNGIAMAKSSDQLLVAQGVIRGLNALENTLASGVVMGEELIEKSKNED